MSTSDKLENNVNDANIAGANIVAAINSLSAKVADVKQIEAAADAFNTSVEAIPGAPVIDINESMNKIIGDKIKDVIGRSDDVIAAAYTIKRACSKYATSVQNDHPTFSYTYSWTGENTSASIIFEWCIYAARYVMTVSNANALATSGKMQDTVMYCYRNNPKRVIVANYDESNGKPFMVYFYKFPADSGPMLDGTVTKFD